MPTRVIMSAAAFLLLAPALAVPAASAATRIDIRNNGATPDDATDDTDAIVKTIAEARENNATVLVPPGVFQHRGVLELNGVDLTGTGPASVLKATDFDRQAVRVTGAGVAVTDLTLTSTATKRGSKKEQHRLLLDKATDFRVERVVVDGSAAAGIFDYGGRHGVIRDNVVQHTRADGIHHTAGATAVRTERNTVTATGDDLIAVVGYGTGDDAPTDLTITGNTLSANLHGRGIAVVGAKTVLIADNSITSPAMAGLYIASEASYKSNGVQNVHVVGNTINDAGSTVRCTQDGQPNCGQGAVHVFANNLPVTGVTFSRNRILNSRIYAVHLNGVFGPYNVPQNQDVAFDGNRIVNSGADALYLSDSFRGEARFSGNRVWGANGLGLRYEKPFKGSSLRVTDNLFGETTDPKAVISIEAGTPRSLTVTGNRHHALTPPSYFLRDCATAEQETYRDNESPSPTQTN